MNVRVLLTLAVAAAMLSACASVTSDIAFQAPGEGWTASPPILGRTQIWVKQGGSSNNNSVVILVRGVSTSQNVFQNPGFGATSTRLQKNEHTTICGNEPAEHLLGIGNSNGHAETFEAYLASVRGDQYLAMYMHPQGVPSDAAAETAIKSLCPKPV